MGSRSRLRAWGSHPLFNALTGVVYLVDRDGVVAAVGEANWANAARESGAGISPPPPDEVVGRPLESFFAGAAVRDHYRRLASAVLSRRLPSVELYHRCDTADRRRDMRLAMTPVVDGADVLGLLYQSSILRGAMRPPVTLLDAPVVEGDDEGPPVKADTPIVGICSYCKAVRWPPGPANGAAERWVETETYYRLGGTDSVRLSHGVCPACAEQVLALIPG